MPPIQAEILLIQDGQEGAASQRLLAKATEICQGLNLRGRVAVVMAAMLVLAFMVMLFLWHYKCIVIDHLCQGIRESETPIFTSG
ncbi:hypothetical protein GDO78_017404 [Eleutherodactylus coqui]|uniref:Uncharacterized protein n=1 Tax=Eleutherodactylus coqui TaxID=57060 RepID=A0A8J6BJ09_ELECQ|nr:hypothetical protein GDO78_017404 [Eleutherodactylus coqui]